MQQQSSFRKTDYLLAPHEWMRVGAMKLIGKSYHYRPETHRIASEEELTFGEQLFYLLFPLISGTVLALFIVVTWAFSFAWIQSPLRLPDYFWQAPLWHHLLHLSWIVLLAYTFIFSYDDVIMASRLLRQHRRHQ